jgi:hypothetical protein
LFCFALALQNVYNVHNAVLCRRTQDEEAIKNPRVKLPDLEVIIKYLEFNNQEERDLYNLMEEVFESRITLMNGKGSNFKAQVMDGIMRLRQVRYRLPSIAWSIAYIPRLHTANLILKVDTMYIMNMIPNGIKYLAIVHNNHF